MLRKRLLGLLATILLSLNAAPAAALSTSGSEGSDVSEVTVSAVEVAKDNGRLGELLANASRAAMDPEVDVALPGVGGVLVDIDEENMSLTVGVVVEPAGIDESITLGGGASEEPGEEQAQVDDTGLTPQEQAAAEDKAAMQEAKDAAAARAAADAARRPAFASGTTASGPTSGNAGAGTGVMSSTRPTTTAPDLGAPSAATDFAVDGQNPWIRIMGVMMLAGTGTAWSMAKKFGLH